MTLVLEVLTQPRESWSNATVWNGSQIPNLNNDVTINHNINVPDDYKGYTGQLTLTPNGVVNFNQNATIQLGQSISNNLLQKIDFQYHIRGGLLGLNLSNGNTSTTSDSDLFSYKLDYGFDGNIIKQAWRNAGNGTEKSFKPH